MVIEIREATSEDYDDLCVVIDQVDTLHCENLGQIFQKPRGPIRDKAYILSLIEDEDTGLFVAEVSGEVTGFVHIAICESPPISIFVPRRYAVVENLAVSQGFRQAGVGRALMERAHQWASAQEATEIELTVYEFNETAIDFYQSLGYETQSRHMYRPVREN